MTHILNNPKLSHGTWWPCIASSLLDHSPPVFSHIGLQNRCQKPHPVQGELHGLNNACLSSCVSLSPPASFVFQPPPTIPHPRSMTPPILTLCTNHLPSLSALWLHYLQPQWLITRVSYFTSSFAFDSPTTQLIGHPLLSHTCILITLHSPVSLTTHNTH